MVNPRRTKAQVSQLSKELREVPRSVKFCRLQQILGSKICVVIFHVHVEGARGRAPVHGDVTRRERPFQLAWQDRKGCKAVSYLLVALGCLARLC